MGLTLFYQYLFIILILVAVSSSCWRRALTHRYRRRPVWQWSLLTLLSILALGAALLPLGLGLYYRFLWPPRKALQEFYDYRCIEPFHEDPLIVSGRRVLPMVMKEIKDQHMPHRRYAIGFLARYPESISVLATLLADEGENVHCRGDCLLSIYEIDSSAGTRYAEEFRTRDDFLGYIARELLTRTEAVCSDPKPYVGALTDWVMRTGEI